MPQIFHRSANTLSKVSLAGILMLVGSLIGLAMLLGRSSYVTRAQEYVEQPVQFSHLHHVLDDGIDCRYCHTSVETSSFAGIPPTKTCMNCHSQIWQSAPILEPVRASFREDKPMQWIRVHDLPDFVYFNHSIHVKKGMGCETCHGRVDQMPLIEAAEFAPDGMVSQLSPQPAGIRASARRGLHDGLPAARGPGNAGAEARGRVRHQAQHRLLDVSSVTRS